MANATVGTVNALVANGQLADPSGDALNTGTTAVTLQYSLSGKTDRAVFRVTNGGSHSATFQVNAGAYPPAFEAGLGAFSGTVAAGATAWFGPFDSAQFIQSSTNAGNLSVTFTPSGGDTITGSITCFNLPKV